MNSNLNKAKKAKNDEFYTQYADIEKELQYYDFEDKVVYCNCDHPILSNFVKYFCDNYHKLKLKGLISTFYSEEGKSFVYRFDGLKESKKGLNGNGSYDSEECLKLLEECDVVVTNPPFSLFRPYIKLLMDYNKKFLVIGNGNAVTYKEIFPYIKNNELWIGYKGFSGGMDFIAGNNYDESKCLHPKYDDKGNIIINVMMCVWFTNIPYINTKQPLILTKTYNPEDYPKYDNYDAINVDKVKDIPMDYDGVMGVPITFLQYYNPSQFEIIGITENADYLKSLYINGCQKYDRPYINGKPKYARILIKKKDSLEPVEFEIVGALNIPVINKTEIYKRVLIRLK